MHIYYYLVYHVNVAIFCQVYMVTTGAKIVYFIVRDSQPSLILMCNVLWLYF